MKLTIMPVGMLGTNCYLLSSEQNHCVIIDPGAQPEKIASVMDREGLTPRYILLTHGHYDHVGGVKKLLEQYDGLNVYIGAPEAAGLTDPAKSHAVSRGFGEAGYLVERVETVKEGDTFALDELTIKAIETPGHTLGGITYLCEGLMFSGDTLFRGDVGRTDLEGGDYPTLKRSLKKLCLLDGDYEVYPGHGEASTLNLERAHNPYINE